MPQKYWVSSENLSADSSIDSSVKSVQGERHANGKCAQESQESSVKPSNENALMPTMAASMTLPNLQPQQHATLFYLSLIEGRCRTQAASTINSRLRPQDRLPEGHPEICELAQRLFNETKKELLKAGMIPEEFAGHSLPDLQRYLNSFDALLNNIATRHNQDISIQTNNYRVLNGSPFSLSGDLSPLSGYSKALIRRTPKVCDEIEMAPQEVDPTVLALLYPQDGISHYAQSVYNSQYSELGVLGRGGCGAVYKVFDRVDRAEYAIKKVVIKAKQLGKLRSEGRLLHSELGEIQTLAILNHPHVVRYYHSWVEFRPASVNTVDNDSTVDSRSDSDEVSATKTNSWQEPDTDRVQSVISELANFSFARNNLMAELKNEVNIDSAAAEALVLFEDSKEPSIQTRSAPNAESSKAMALGRQENLKATSSKVNVDAILYIKMKAYPLTLHDYLYLKTNKNEISELRHCFHILPTVRILLAVLKGMQYIHRRNIIHRDLKPHNIFLSALDEGEPPTSDFINVRDCSDCDHSKPVKAQFLCPHIGDFGLIHVVKAVSSPQEVELHDVTTAPKESKVGSVWKEKGDSFVVGTPYYAPPRVPGVKETFCPKRDCYALGVIALELIYPFDTTSERHKVLDKLRKEGILPAELQKHKMAEGILGMLKNDIAERWDLDRVKEWLLELERDCRKG